MRHADRTVFYVIRDEGVSDSVRSATISASVSLHNTRCRIVSYQCAVQASHPFIPPGGGGAYSCKRKEITRLYEKGVLYQFFCSNRSCSCVDTRKSAVGGIRAFCFCLAHPAILSVHPLCIHLRSPSKTLRVQQAVGTCCLPSVRLS